MSLDPKEQVVLIPLSENWFDLVVEHHHQIESCFNKILATTNEELELRNSLEKELTEILVAHSKAEEASIYLYLEKYGMKKEASKLFAEQKKAGDINTKLLQNVDKNTDEWLKQVEDLKKAVVHHAEVEEEGDLFKRLLEATDEAANLEITKAYKKAFIKEELQETAAVKDESNYKWHEYTHDEPHHVFRKIKGGYVKTALGKGTKFGVRSATSGKDAGKVRLILHGHPASHVHTLEPGNASTILAKSKKIDLAKSPPKIPVYSKPMGGVDHKYAAAGHARMAVKSFQNGNEENSILHDEAAAHHMSNGQHKLAPTLHHKLSAYHAGVANKAQSKSPYEAEKHFELSKYHKNKGNE